MSPFSLMLAALALAAAPVAAWRVIRPFYRLATPADEAHFARTDDGWDLALYRYRPAALTPGREPVLLCHGMLSNRFNVDLDERISLSRYLRDRGFDTWVMELRGHGGSRRRVAGRPFDWNLDDYIQKDVPSALDYVRNATGIGQVHWFGHSMGGMLLYAACVRPEAEKAIRSAALSDAPASFAPLRTRVRLGKTYARLFPAVPPALVLPYLGPLVWLAPRIMQRRYGLGERDLLMRILSNAIISWGSSRALMQFCETLESGRLRSADGRIDYEEGVSRIRFPLLVLSAARKLMDEGAIRGGFERAASTDKKYLRLTRDNGYLADYTHSSLLLSRSSHEEVYPLIADWFATHSTA